MSVLELRSVCRTYGQGAAEVHALSDVNMTVQAAELVAVMGPSGSGKSTLLTIAGTLEEASAGEVLIDGVAVSTLASDDRAALRRHRIGYVFQDFNLLSGLTAVENVAMPLELDGQSRAAARAAALTVLDGLGLAGLADRLSGRVVRRRTAANGHCPRRGRAATAAAGRRADRRAGLDQRRVGACGCCGRPAGTGSPVCWSRTMPGWRRGPTASSICAMAASSMSPRRCPARSRCS